MFDYFVKRKALLGIALFFSIALLGILNYLLDPILDFYFFYFFPIMIAAVLLGSGWSYLLAGAATVMDHFVEFKLGFPYHHTWVNSAFALLTYFFVAFISSRMAENYRTISSLELEQRMDLEAARTIQESLFPVKIPIGLPVDISAKISFFRQVGGDFYDIFLTKDKKVAFAIGDIMGKSISAALFSTVLRENFRNSLSINPSPVPLAIDMNERLIRQLPEDMFVTFLYGIYDPEKNVVKLVNCGHEPAILIRSRSAGPEFTLGKDRKPLGIDSDFRPSETEVTVNKNAILFIFTDGLINFSEGRQLDYLSLGRKVFNSRELDSRKLIESVIDSIFSQGFEQIDDYTALCIEF